MSMEVCLPCVRSAPAHLAARLAGGVPEDCPSRRRLAVSGKDAGVMCVVRYCCERAKAGSLNVHAGKLHRLQ